LIDGPGYRQEFRYNARDVRKAILYNLDFTLKLEKSPGFRNTVFKDDPSTKICQLEVTAARFNEPGGQNIVERIVVDSLILKLGDFKLNQWTTKGFKYSLDRMNSVLNPGKDNRSPASIDTFLILKDGTRYVEFRVKWFGNVHYKLFVDDIQVYDENAKTLFSSAGKKEILDQDNFSNVCSCTDYKNYIVGWFAYDEPETIDSYEPIRFIDSLISSNSNGKRRLYVSFPSSWNGKFNNSPNGAEPIYKFEEFALRTKGVFISDNKNMYTPYNANQHFRNGPDEVENYRSLCEVLSGINKYYLSGYCDHTIICGKYLSANILNNPTPAQMLNEANIKLLFGSKILNLYRYFGNNADTNFTGLVVNNAKGDYIYTDRYYFVRNTLAPRLHGFFGKTLRKINPTAQYTDVSFGTAYSFITSLSYPAKSSCRTSMNPEVNPGYDLGFFEDNSGSKYFMILRRWYQTAYDCPLVINYDLSSTGVNNWKVLNTIDGSISYHNSKDTLTAVLGPGEAILYKMTPVLK